MSVLYVTAFASGGAPGTGPIFLRGLQCSGNEQNILDCQADNTIPYDLCPHDRDLTFYCYNITQSGIYIYNFFIVFGVWGGGTTDKMPKIIFIYKMDAFYLKECGAGDRRQL